MACMARSMKLLRRAMTSTVAIEYTLLFRSMLAYIDVSSTGACVVDAVLVLEFEFEDDEDEDDDDDEDVVDDDGVLDENAPLPLPCCCCNCFIRSQNWSNSTCRSCPIRVLNVKSCTL